MARISQAQAVQNLTAGLQELPDNYVMCRDVKHAWMIEDDFHIEASQSEGKRIQWVRRVLVCGRCDTRRYERYTLGKYGLDKVSQWYVHASDYLLPGVPRGVKPSSIVQQEMYRRAMEKVAGASPRDRDRADR